MTKRMYTAAGVVATISLLVCAGCTRTTGKPLESNAEFRQIKASLEESLQQKAVLAKDVERLKGSLSEAESKLAAATTSRTNLEAKVSSVEAKVAELTKSRDDLQKMVQNLVDTRGVLENQVATLTKAKNAALEDARNAQSKVDELNERLKAQTQQVADLQEQIKTVRSVLQQLQQKLD
jgi:chromosome segregation ATPase